jgi:DNA replication and repair protein RecF
MRSLAIESLNVRSFRNLTSVDLELGPRFNVLSGDNGQGKTNLLEAVYVLATSRSFRTSRQAELVRVGSDAASVRATIREQDDAREQSVGLGHGVRRVRVDGKRPPTLAAYALRTPVVVFHPGAVALSTGSGGERRKLLDRVALYQSPAALGEAEGYAKALRARQRVLEVRGESAAELEHWEELVVRHGRALAQARLRAAEALAPAAEREFARIGGETPFRVRYAPNAPADGDEYRSVLARWRARDRARGSAAVGPHRDDLVVELGGGPARGRASQGQHRAIVLALELGEIEVICEARMVRPILLLDDVSSELDRARTAALFAALRRGEGQVLLTTTRPELIETGELGGDDGRRDFVVAGGRIRPGPATCG